MEQTFWLNNHNLIFSLWEYMFVHYCVRGEYMCAYVWRYRSILNDILLVSPTLFNWVSISYWPEDHQVNQVGWLVRTSQWYYPYHSELLSSDIKWEILHSLGRNKEDIILRTVSDYWCVCPPLLSVLISRRSPKTLPKFLPLIPLSQPPTPSGIPWASAR